MLGDEIYPCTIAPSNDWFNCECIVDGIPVISAPEQIRHKTMGNIKETGVIDRELQILKCGDTYSLTETVYYENGIKLKQILSQSDDLEDLTEDFDYPILQ